MILTTIFHRPDLLVALVFAPLAAACPLTSGGGGGGGGTGKEERIGPIDFMRFVQDQPAVGGDWYAYDEEGGHVLTPLAHAYVIREGSEETARYAALRIVSYYDPDTAESGRFTVSTSTWAGAWSDEEPWVTRKNVKTDGPVCLDLFARLERPCEGDAWQVMLRAYRFLAREGPIVVNQPGLFVRSAVGLPEAGDVKVATLTDRSTLSGLPNPTTLDEHRDAPPTSWESIEWSRDAFASDLPLAGMALGERFVDEGFVGRDDRYLLLNAPRSLVRFEVRPKVDGDVESGLSFTFTKVKLEIGDNTIPKAVPPAHEVSVAMPPLGQTTFLSFEEDALVLSGAALDGTALPHLVPVESRWDLALRRTFDGRALLLLSPGAALYNATALAPEPPASLEETLPPTLEGTP